VHTIRFIHLFYPLAPKKWYNSGKLQKTQITRKASVYKGLMTPDDSG
jgi:hypothetical protein